MKITKQFNKFEYELNNTILSGTDPDIKITNIDFGFKNFTDENMLKKGDIITIIDKEQNINVRCKVIKVNKEDYHEFAKLKVLERNHIN